MPPLGGETWNRSRECRKLGCRLEFCMDKRPELLSGKQHTTLSEGGKATAYIKNETKNHDRQYGNQKYATNSVDSKITPVRSQRPLKRKRNTKIYAKTRRSHELSRRLAPAPTMCETHPNTQEHPMSHPKQKRKSKGKLQ